MLAGVDQSEHRELSDCKHGRVSVTQLDVSQVMKEGQHVTSLSQVAARVND